MIFRQAIVFAAVVLDDISVIMIKVTETVSFLIAAIAENIFEVVCAGAVFNAAGRYHYGRSGIGIIVGGVVEQPIAVNVGKKYWIDLLMCC